MGRPSKLTVRVQDKICAALRGGMSPEGASEFGGIDRATFYRWLDLGKSGRSKRYQEFRRAVLEARSNLEGRITTKLLKAIDEGRTELAIPYLERRFPDRWGKRDRIDVSANVTHGGGVKITPSPVYLPEEEPDEAALPKRDKSKSKKAGAKRRPHDGDDGARDEDR